MSQRRKLRRRHRIEPPIQRLEPGDYQAQLTGVELHRMSDGTRVLDMSFRVEKPLDKGPGSR